MGMAVPIFQFLFFFERSEFAAGGGEGVDIRQRHFRFQHVGGREHQAALFAVEGVHQLTPAGAKYQDVIDHGNKNIASLAKFSLAQIAFQENKSPEAETLLHDLMDHPTDLVSAEQAAITLADGIKTKNPAEARKLLEPLAKENGELAGTASRILSELPK